MQVCGYRGMLAVGYCMKRGKVPHLTARVFVLMQGWPGDDGVETQHSPVP